MPNYVLNIGVPCPSCQDEEILKKLDEILKKFPLDEPILALPDYYGVRVGANRPALVLIYKERINGKWGATTHASTVHYPTPAAIEDVFANGMPDKQQGPFFAALNLTDGSVLKSTGNSFENALMQLQYLISLANPAYLPVNYQSLIVKGTYQISSKTLVARKVEYYPNGTGQDVKPTKYKFFDS